MTISMLCQSDVIMDVTLRLKVFRSFWNKSSVVSKKKFVMFEI